jgi:hypothetical protein
VNAGVGNPGFVTAASVFANGLCSLCRDARMAVVIARITDWLRAEGQPRLL